MLTRRVFFRTCSAFGAVAGASALGGLGLGCLGGPIYKVTVMRRESVLAATARGGLEVRVARRSWGNPELRGLQMVTAIDGFGSNHWVFEVNGRRHDGSRDAAERTIVEPGDTIVWFET